MPGSAYSILKFDTIDDFTKMKQFLTSKQGEVDFDTISPVPAPLEIPAKPPTTWQSSLSTATL